MAQPQPYSSSCDSLCAGINGAAWFILIVVAAPALLGALAVAGLYALSYPLLVIVPVLAVVAVKSTRRAATNARNRRIERDRLAARAGERAAARLCMPDDIDQSELDHTQRRAEQLIRHRAAIVARLVPLIRDYRAPVTSELNREELADYGLIEPLAAAAAIAQAAPPLPPLQRLWKSQRHIFGPIGLFLAIALSIQLIATFGFGSFLLTAMSAGFVAVLVKIYRDGSRGTSVPVK